MFHLLLCPKKMAKNFLHESKSGFKRTAKWNKYRSQMTVQSKNNNLREKLLRLVEIMTTD